MINLATLRTFAEPGVITCEAIARIDSVLDGCAYLANTLCIAGRTNHLQCDRIALINGSSGFAGNAISHFFSLDSAQNVTGRFHWIRHVSCKCGKTTYGRGYGSHHNRLAHWNFPPWVVAPLQLQISAAWSVRQVT